MLTQSNKIDFNGQHIYAGIDDHLKSWNVTVMTEELIIKTFSQNPSPEILYQFLTRNFPNAIYHTAYEAGFVDIGFITGFLLWELIQLLSTLPISQQRIRKKLTKRTNVTARK